MLPPDYIDPEGYWIATSLYTLTFGYNTDLVAKGAEPKSLEELLDPKWRGKIAVSGNASPTGVAGLVGLAQATMGEQQGVEYLKRLAVQRPAVIQASTRQVLDMVIAGEYSVGLQILNHHVAFSANRGAPAAWVKLDPVMGTFLVLAVIKGPHPNAGKLLVDFLMSDEGQAIFRDADYVPVSPNVMPKDPSLRPDGKSFRALFFTPEKLDENISRWMGIYSEILR
jgi:iron(III) transport system substrate-binding protein